MKTQTPYPSLIEIIRAIAVLLETKKPIAKFLDDKNRNFLAAGLEEKLYLLDEVVKKPLKIKLTPLMSGVLFELFDAYTYEYIQLIGQTSIDGLTRDEVMDALSEHIVSEFWVSLLEQVHHHCAVPMKTLYTMCAVESSALQIISKWVGNKFPGGYEEWLVFARTSLRYDDGDAAFYKYHLSEYSEHSSQSLPSQQTLYRLFAGESHLGSDARCQNLTLLTLARVMDAVKRMPILKKSLEAAFGPACANQSESSARFVHEICAAKNRKGIDSDKLQAIYKQLDVELSFTNPKDSGASHRALMLLDEARTLHKAITGKDNSRLDKSYFYQARFSALYGDLTASINHYGTALEQAIYRDGPLLGQIIEEGYCIGARAGKGSQVILKKLKIAATSYCFDGVAAHGRKPFSNTVGDHLKSWEVEMWAAGFDQLVKPECMFESANVPVQVIEPWFLKQYPDNETTLNPRYKDTKKKTGKVITHTSPQLILSIQKKQYDIFIQLMEKGADVNVFNDQGGTPLILALYNMNPMMHDNVKDYRKYLLPLLEIEHNFETLASYDHMSTSTALSCSINTGQVYYVEKILNLMRAALLSESPGRIVDEVISRRVTRNCVSHLFYVLQLIGGVTHRESLTFYQQSAYRYDVEQLRCMAALLIDHGAVADAREVNQSPPGFNAFWLAIQLDESVILSKMLGAGVDCETPLVNLNTRATMTPTQFAEAHSAKGCMQVLAHD